MRVVSYVSKRDTVSMYPVCDLCHNVSYTLSRKHSGYMDTVTQGWTVGYSFTLPL